MRKVGIRVPTTFFDGGTAKDLFHGTMETAARDICEKGFRIPANPASYYGDGVYFFEGDYTAALWFATSRRHHEGLTGDVAVIRAEVDLGKTLFANVLGGEIAKLQKTFKEWYGTEWSAEEVFRLVCQELRGRGKIDSVKFVRQAEKSWREPKAYRAEVVVLVYEATQIKRTALHVEKNVVQCTDLVFEE